MAKKVALVAGASGVTGQALLEHFDGRDDWRVIGLASRLPEGTDPGRFVAMDLLDPDECARKANGLGDVTHVFFAAYREQPTEAAQVVTNGAMLMVIAVYVAICKEIGVPLAFPGTLVFDRLFRDLRQRKLIP
jgi:nucleoside-diphosphate-sugar epimerase